MQENGISVRSAPFNGDYVPLAEELLDKLLMLVAQRAVDIAFAKPLSQESEYLLKLLKALVLERMGDDE